MKIAVVTGASAGLGRALARGLAERGWHLVIDARGDEPLRSVAEELGRLTRVDALVGDIADATHRAELVGRVGGRNLDLLVQNASTLGPRGLRRMADHTEADLRAAFETNVIAPTALTIALIPALQRARGTVVTISSDAAVEHYGTWGGYGASKAALDHLAMTVAAEHPELAVYAVDPGDMRTAMHQQAFPEEDLSGLPAPESVVEPLLALVDGRRPSGRFRVSDLALEEVSR